MPWLEMQTSINFIRVYSKFGSEDSSYNNYRMDGLLPTVLYQLAAPSTPESAVVEIISRA